MRAPSILAGLLTCMAACSGEPTSPPALDPEHLPAELRGLMPGVATEAELAAAYPDAAAVRDQSFGGGNAVHMSGEPAIQVQSRAAAAEAWLVWIDHELRIGSMFARIRRSCPKVIGELGGRVRRGPCSPRAKAAREHPYCATTPDGRYTIDLSCFDRAKGHAGWISIYVNFAPATARRYSIGAPRDLEE